MDREDVIAMLKRARPLKWAWYRITATDVATVCDRIRRERTKPQTSWPQPVHMATVSTSCGLTLELRASEGNPHLPTSFEALSQMKAGNQVRLAVEDDRIVSIGLARAVHHPKDDAILAAHGIDVAMSHAWARGFQCWRDEAPHQEDPVMSEYPCIRTDGRVTANFAVTGGKIHVSRADAMAGGDYGYQSGELLVAGIPHTVATALRGRRLDRVMTAPRLDGLGLRIHAVTIEEDYVSLRVVPKAGWLTLI